MSVEPGQSGQRAIFLPRSAFFWRMGASLSPARPVKRRNSRELVRLRVSPLESNMGSHTPSRKPFVIKYGGMAYRGEGDIYHLIDRTGNRARAKGTASRQPGLHRRKNHPAPLSSCWSSCANAGQNASSALENLLSAPTLVKFTDLLDFCTCIHRLSGRTVALN